MSAAEWTKEDSRAASAEGWDFFESSEHGFEIERIDEMAYWISDDDCLAYIEIMAASGSPLHLKAIRIDDTEAYRGLP